MKRLRVKMLMERIVGMGIGRNFQMLELGELGGFWYIYVCACVCVWVLLCARLEEAFLPQEVVGVLGERNP